MATDRLSLANALEAANIDRPVAERIATEIYDAIHDNVATKADLRELGLRLEKRIDAMVIRLGAIAVIVAGLPFAALQRWPPHL
jgi:hypothetical protein